MVDLPDDATRSPIATAHGLMRCADPGASPRSGWGAGPRTLGGHRHRRTGVPMAALTP